jgi:hypothetical protein
MGTIAFQSNISARVLKILLPLLRQLPCIAGVWLQDRQRVLRLQMDGTIGSKSRRRWAVPAKCCLVT